MHLTDISLVGGTAYFAGSRPRAIKCHYTTPQGIKIFFDGIQRPLCYESDGTCVNRGGDMDIVSIDFEGIEVAIYGDL